jgi:hypothetical protein
MPRALALALAAMAALLVAAAPAPAKTTRHFFEFTRFQPVDVGPAGDSVGDMTVFAVGVYDRRTGGKQLGTGHGYCVRTEAGVASTCTANTGLGGGRMVLAWEQRDGERTAVAAIIGGTGRYKAARGDLVLTMAGRRR